MGIVLKQTDQRSQYQEKIAAELQEKLRSKNEPVDLPDHVKDSNYLIGSKESNITTKVWLIIGIAAVIIFGYLAFKAISKQNG